MMPLRDRREDRMDRNDTGGNADTDGDCIMVRTFAIAVASTLALLAGVQSAQAFGPGSLAKGLADNRGIQYLVARQATLAPFSFVKFCRSNPADCSRANGPTVAHLTVRRERELRRVNAEVNRSITPVNEIGTQDRWQADVAAGDCEDFVLTKRRKLVALGWSPRALRIAVTRTAAGEGHAVLVVKTSKGDLVLDNRTSAVKRFQRTDLSWIKIQSAENPKMWYTL
jgi:predicted transglutaminase-like cysteine proteinase